MAIGSFDDSARERLSALADGELDAAESAACCAAWRGDAALRADWHDWHLIGDVLRSEELAFESTRDRRLLESVRQRLRDEPVVLAPAAAVAAPQDRRSAARTHPGRWTAGAAVAAGFVLVLGTFALVRPGEPPVPQQLASNDVAPAVKATTGTPGTETPAPATVIVADSQLIRDAQLDRYLEAHKQFSGTSALGLPSAFLRSATVDSVSR